MASEILHCNLLPAGKKDSAFVTALPGGNGNTGGGSFNNVGNNGNWWTATENGSANAYNRNMNYNNDNANLNNNDKTNLFSVRLVQDCEQAAAECGMPPPLFPEPHQAYMDARRHKRNTINQIKFERKLEAEQLSLCHEIEAQAYEPKPGICFINELPVKREIIAADFRDRIVHHFLYNKIYPIFDRLFIYDSYSCRVGKGTLFGIKRAWKFLKADRSAWALRLDIQGFFMAIDRDVLFSLIMKGLRKHKPLPHCEFLIRKIVYNDPIKNAVFKSPPGAWSDLPRDKTLRGSAPNCGLPIGNLTSQLFANVYLNPLDHFVKRELKIKRYGRYVDDMLLIHSDKQVLLNAISRIREFLKTELKLTLHPKKIRLQPANKGFAFLGAYVYPNKIVAGKRVLANFRSAVINPAGNSEMQERVVQSYLGLLKHF